MLATTPTQNPQFIWIIAAVRRDMPTIKPQLHHVAAPSEREARRSLVRDHGYAVNKRGLTVGIGYQLISSDTKTATAHAVLQAQREGLSHVRITRVQEVSA